METLLVENVIPLELVHQTELQQERTEEVEHGLGVVDVQQLLGEDHPLLELYRSLHKELLHFCRKLFLETFFKFCPAFRLVKIQARARIVVSKLRQHSEFKIKSLTEHKHCYFF